MRPPIPDSGELDPFGEGAHLVVERDKPRRFYLVEEPPEKDDSEDEDDDSEEDEDEEDFDDDDEEEADDEEDPEDKAEDDEAGGEEGGEKEDEDDEDPKARARRFGRGMKAREVGPGSIHTAKWDRCTKKVRARGGPYNEYAVCTASVGYEGSIKAGHRRKGKTKEADALDHELQAIYRESARGTFEEARPSFASLRLPQGQPIAKGRKKKRQPLLTAAKKRRQPLYRGSAR